MYMYHLLRFKKFLKLVTSLSNTRCSSVSSDIQKAKNSDAMMRLETTRSSTHFPYPESMLANTSNCFERREYNDRWSLLVKITDKLC